MSEDHNYAAWVEAMQTLARVRKVRDGYADQAKFADIDCAVHFREFVRRLDEAIKPPSPPKFGGRP